MDRHARCKHKGCVRLWMACDDDGTMCDGQCWDGRLHVIFVVCDALLSLTINRFDCGMDIVL